MATRVRKGGKDENRPTHNVVWGEYIHLTSRPVDGVADPLLHGHCYAFNTTFDAEAALELGLTLDRSRESLAARKCKEIPSVKVTAKSR